ncbi:hypothetical protein BJX99DRAFT_231566 [Aspergillus californicus]
MTTYPPSPPTNLPSYQPEPSSSPPESPEETITTGLAWPFTFSQRQTYTTFPPHDIESQSLDETIHHHEHTTDFQTRKGLWLCLVIIGYFVLTAWIMLG